MESLKSRRDSIVKSAIESIGTTARLCQKVLDEKDVPDRLEKLKKYVQSYCESDMNYDIHAKALQQTEDFYKTSENEIKHTFEAKFKHFYDAEKTKHKNEITKHPYMIQYLRAIEDQEGGNDSENEETNEPFAPLVDPITKAFIRNPVRNTQCGHIYENDSIRALIAKKSTRCPYIGCPALEYIQVAHLAAEETLKRKIDAHFLQI